MATTTQTPRITLYRLTASIDRDGTLLGCDDVLADDASTRWTSREDAEDRAAELQEEIAAGAYDDVDPATSITVTEADDLPRLDRLVLAEIDALPVQAGDVEDLGDDTRAVTLRLVLGGRNVEGEAILAPMASGQGWQAAGALDAWLSDDLLTLAEAMPERERRQLATRLQMAAAAAIDCR